MSPPIVEGLMVTISANDQVTPVLRRITRRLWWLRHGEAVLLSLWTLAVFIAGIVTGHLT